MNIAIIIHTCDKYNFCWEGWDKQFQQLWDFELGFDIFFVNEKRDISFNNVKQLRTGKGEWSDRLLYALQNIKHKHIFYFQEDMWMVKRLNHLTQYYQDFIKHDMNYLMFNVQLSQNRKDSFFRYDGLLDDKYLIINKEKSPWLMFHQPAIWKKDFMMEQLQYNENPWVNEIEGTKRLKLLKEPIKLYNVNELEHWYQPVCNEGVLTPNATEIMEDRFL